MKRPGLTIRLLLISIVISATVGLTWLTSAWAQTGGSLDLRRNVVAGGGGTSIGSGSKQIDGTVGEASAGPTMSGGALTQTGGFWNTLAQPTPLAGPGVFAFSASSYRVNEHLTEASITVNRSNGTTSSATVDFSVTNGTGFTPCNQFTVLAAQNCDFSFTSGTLSFAGGDTFKSFSVLISKDAYIEGNETINLLLSNPTSSATLGTPSTATLTIIDNTSVPTSSQPIDDAATFVGQHYHDFLARQADPGGQDFWTSQITQCGSDASCLRNQRISVSNAFFYELEYQQTGSYVFRIYRAAFGNNQPFPNPDSSNQIESKKLPSYAVFAPDRARVVGGTDLPSGQLNFANAFVLRNEFLAKYPANQNGPTFVDAVLATIRNDTGVDLGSQRSALIDLFNSGGPGAVLYRLADDNAQSNPINNRPFIDEEYNRAFVATQYFGYLRRDADIGGFLFWLGQVNGALLRDTSRQHAMVCSFITSTEYQQRFSAVVTHSNSECQ